MKRRPFRAEEFISNEKTPVETFSNDTIVKVEITTVAGNTMERYPVEGLATFRSGRVHDFTWTETGVHDIEDPEYTDLNLWFSATPDVMEIFHFFAKEWFARKLFGVLTHDSLHADRPSAWNFCWWLPYGVFALAIIAGLWALYFLIPGGAK